MKITFQSKVDSISRKIKDIFRTKTIKKALERRDPEYIKPPTTDEAKEDRLLRDLIIEMGAGGLPEILSQEELDAHIEMGETELFRGLSGNPVYCDHFREGPLFVGCGLRGNGIYSAYGENALKTIRRC